MRIAMLTTWNVTDGASLHAELLGRELSKTSELTVFAPTFESLAKDRHLLPLGSDDDFVIRAFQLTWGAPGWVDERLREQEFDVLVVEALDRMPIPTLLEMFPKIKAKKVQVIHEWALPEGPGYYELGFDAIVCFDRRYRTMLLERYPEQRIHIIPYPCHPHVRGDKATARAKLGLSKDALILFSFGRQPLFEYDDYLWLASELGKERELTYLMVRSDDQGDWETVGKRLQSGSSFCEVRFERPSIDRLYDYLHASDVHLLPKAPSSEIVVSSTVFQCLGSGTPIVIPDTRYVELLDKEVVRYRPHDRAHLKSQVSRLLNEESFRKATVTAATEYVQENSAHKIAEKFVDLFRSLEEQPSDR